MRRLLCLGNATLAIAASGRAYTFGGGGRTAANADDDDDDDDDDVDEEVIDAMEPDPDATLPAQPQHAQGTPSTTPAPSTEHAPSTRPPASSTQETEQQQEAATQRGLQRGLGRLLGTRRLLAENVSEAAGCEDHLLLLADDGSCRGLGYNRYGQACSADERLRLAEPTAMPSKAFALERVLMLAAGGGCSLVLTGARETLAACCVATLKARLNAGDARRCAEVLGVASVCHSPALALLAGAVASCAGRYRQQVVAECEAIGVSDVDAALHALNEMANACAGADHGAEACGTDGAMEV